MDFIQLIALTRNQKKEVLHLWNTEYPEKLNYQNLPDFDKYLASLKDQSHIILVDKHQKIKAWYFDFNREDKKWFAIIIDTTLHGKGYGTKLLNLAKEKEPELNGWVVDHNKDIKKNGQYYSSPLDFYLKNGFNKMDNNRLELEKISAVQIKWNN